MMDTNKYQKMLSALSSEISPLAVINDVTQTKLNIDNRTINVPTNFKDIVVEGDANSRSITFTMRRYYDGVDLSDKTVIIKYVNANSQGDWYHVEEIITDYEYIQFTWLVDERVTVIEGTVTYIIEFSGYRDDKEYYLHTNPSFFKVEKGLDVDEHIVSAFPSILQDHELRLTLLKEDFDKVMSEDVISSLVTEAPKDGKLYVRKNGAWIDFSQASDIDLRLYNLETFNQLKIGDVSKLSENLVDTISFINKNISDLQEIVSADLISHDIGNILVRGTDEGLFVPETDLSDIICRVEQLEDAISKIEEPDEILVSNGIVPNDIVPVTKITAKLTISNSQFTGNIIWCPALEDNKFAPETVYTAHILLKAKSGFTFDGVSEALFSIDAVISSLDYDSEAQIVSIVFPATEPKNKDSWEMYYTYDDTPAFVNYKIPLQNWIGWDGTQKLTDAIYHDNTGEYELFANQPKDGVKSSFDPSTAVLIPFDGFTVNPVVTGGIKEWGFDSSVGEYGAIYISGNTPGYEIPMKLIKKEGD